MSEEKISVSAKQVSIGLLIQVVVLVAAGYAFVARIDQRLKTVEEAVRPVGPALIEAAKLEAKVEQQDELIDRLDRDVALNESRLRELQIALEVQKQLSDQGARP